MTLDKVEPLRIYRSECKTRDGKSVSELCVFCPREEANVSIDICAACDHCKGYTFHSSGKGSVLSCTYQLEEVLAKETRERERVDSADDVPVDAVMTRDVLCLRPDADPDEAARLFLQRKIGSAPVVDENGRILGIVTKTDIVREHQDTADTEVATFEQLPQSERGFLSGTRGVHLTGGSATPITSVMTPAGSVVRSGTSLAQASAFMAYENVHHLMVVDRSGKIIGMLSALDVVRWLAHETGYLRHGAESHGTPEAVESGS